MKFTTASGFTISHKQDSMNNIQLLTFIIILLS